MEVRVKGGEDVGGAIKQMPKQMEKSVTGVDCSRDSKFIQKKPC
jgi:hypothetical protein